MRTPRACSRSWAPWPRPADPVRGSASLLAGGAALLMSALSPETTGQALAVGSPEPFRVRFDAPMVEDLRRRLATVRLPAGGAPGWERGMDGGELAALLRHWRDGYDFGAAEARLNAWPQFRVDIGGLPLHYQVAQGRTARRMPLLLLHGWPSSYVQFLPLVPLLTDPVAHGAEADALSFDVVSVSLPGYGWSAPSGARQAVVRDMAERIHLLMTRVLGHERYAVRGTDVGGVVQQQLALLHAEAVIGNHTSGMLRGVPLPPRSDMSAAELRWINENDAWSTGELAYANLHATKPRTLGVALNDSPAGLAAWILEKFHGWSDPSRSLDALYGRDLLIDNLMVYWASGSITSSVEFYYDFRRETGRAQGRVPQPTAVLMGTTDMVPPPRALLDRWYRIERWNELPRGGHFLEWEAPGATARDLREFFEGLLDE